ncbi:ribonuclease CAF1 [Syncephalis pseudoplumigaleata]|uniref:Ribonuclease CAF1 n=1 Tax=Syncephalis pseudoplumigaleata TaxID=1712513 RepID=A0A4P9YXY9_9FUNG|nr:ribonuclease CAF1 [Syncephalis pseudoplumigaleata]|eukprot:RKP24904.1 ribonuclease CAF1 [Syncephalis pseudoplumigaleata]
MEVLRSSFSDMLPEIEEAIAECEFMALDVEFTGLNPASLATPRDIADTVQERYGKVRHQSLDFILCQFGLCTFRWNEQRREYEAKPFNFYLMPASSGIRGAPDRYFQCQASTIDFLARNGFDFTKWLGYGVHFMNWDEERLFRERRENEIANTLPGMQLDERGLQFEQHARQQIDRWLTTKEPSVSIACSNGYHYRIVYHLIQKSKRNAQKRAKMEADVAQAIGFRRVIDMMAQSRKPIVGHHMIMDLCQVYHHLYKSLPEQVDLFAAGILTLFPILLDTKYICMANPDIEMAEGRSIFRHSSAPTLPSMLERYVNRLYFVKSASMTCYNLMALALELFCRALNL